MGWTFGYKSKAEAVREVRGWSGVIDVLDPSTEDERTWEAWGLARYLSEDSDGVILFVVLLEYDPRSRTWGTKVIDELCGPYYYNVPLAFASLPLLTLGLPASTVTAVLYGALLMVGVKPSPFLFQRNPDVIWGLVASMYVGNIMLLILNLPLVGIFVRILSIPARWLLPIVLVISFVGVYSVHNSALDLVMATGLGVVGYLMRKFGYPLAPVILGLVLGDLLEQSLRQALMISGGSVGILFQSWIAKTLFVLAVVVTFAPMLLKRVRG